MSGPKFCDALEGCPGREATPEGEDLVECLEIDPPAARRVGEERLDLGREEKQVSRARIVQGADSDAVAR